MLKATRLKKRLNRAGHRPPNIRHYFPRLQFSNFPQNTINEHPLDIISPFKAQLQCTLMTCIWFFFFEFWFGSDLGLCRWDWSTRYCTHHRERPSLLDLLSEFGLISDGWLGSISPSGDWANALECWRSPSLRLVIPGIAVPPGVTHSDSHHLWHGTVVNPQHPSNEVQRQIADRNIQSQIATWCNSSGDISHRSCDIGTQNQLNAPGTVIKDKLYSSVGTKHGLTLTKLNWTKHWLRHLRCCVVEIWWITWTKWLELRQSDL